VAGLTAQASTFAREDVIAAVGAGLVGAARAELDALADRFLAERAVSGLTGVLVLVLVVHRPCRTWVSAPGACCAARSPAPLTMAG
jgi:hypothetical protein